MNNTNEMRVYIADLASYNNGLVVGSWIDLPCFDIDAAINEVMDAGTAARIKAKVYDGVPSEEWAIVDYEGLDFYGSVSEYEDITALNDACIAYDDLNEQDAKKLGYLMNMMGYDLDGAIDKLEDCDIYEDMSFGDLAELFVDEGLFGEIPSHLENYIDYDAIARDLQYDYTEYSGDIFRCD